MSQPESRPAVGKSCFPRNTCEEKQSKGRVGIILQQANPSLPVTWNDDGVISLVISFGSPVQAENRRFGDYGNVPRVGPLGGDRPFA